jgi:hypothetical protein
MNRRPHHHAQLAQEFEPLQARYLVVPGLLWALVVAIAMTDGFGYRGIEAPAELAWQDPNAATLGFGA